MKQELNQIIFEGELLPPETWGEIRQSTAIISMCEYGVFIDIGLPLPHEPSRKIVGTIDGTAETVKHSPKALLRAVP